MPPHPTDVDFHTFDQSMSSEWLSLTAFLTQEESEGTH